MRTNKFLHRDAWMRGGALLLVGVAVICVDPALAAETAEHGSGGLPQLNPVRYASQIFWTFVTFGLLFLLMSKVALPRVAEVLEARQERITDDLERAQAHKLEADGVIATYEKALAEARANAQNLLATARAETDAEAARRQGALAADLAARSREAEERIGVAKEAALQNVRSVAAEAAQAAAARIAGVELSAEAADDAVGALLKERA